MTVPLAVSSMSKGMGRAIGKRTILSVAVDDSVLVSVVAMVTPHTLKVCPQKHPVMLSRLVLVMQVMT